MSRKVVGLLKRSLCVCACEACTEPGGASVGVHQYQKTVLTNGGGGGEGEVMVVVVVVGGGAA